jgi:hypothetical protein
MTNYDQLYLVGFSLDINLEIVDRMRLVRVQAFVNDKAHW